MYTANPYNIYKQNSVNMASSQQLLLMLLDGAVKYTKIAKMAPKEKVILRKEVYEKVKNENSNAIVTSECLLNILK